MNTMSRLMMSVLILANTPAAFAGKYHEHRRIKNGVASGQLTQDEAQGLRTQKRELNKEGKGIHQEAQEMRAANGGKLTSEERQTVRGQRQDLRGQRKELSKETYQDKHNADVRPNSPAGTAPGTTTTAPVAPVEPVAPATGTNP